MTASPSVLNDETVYTGDNGRVFCGRHAGMKARLTGVDLRGTKVRKTTEFSCESCDREDRDAAAARSK